MSQSDICRDGVVIAVEPESVLVEMTVSSACSSCHAKSFCSTTDEQRRVVRAQLIGNQNIVRGDKVRVFMHESLGKKAILLAYVIPLIILLGTLLGMHYLFENEIISVVIALLTLAVYYFCLKFLSKKISKKFFFYAEKN
ncbi:MAG: SoxR reducing system RseC family protein [Bacteroidales bacterium]|nr:SoxR reducing system RseC family protein [Bacteroidales bacterium]